MKIQRVKDEFILLPMFSIDNWYEPELHMCQRVYTIGWLIWFIRWKGNKIGYDFETQGYESDF